MLLRCRSGLESRPHLNLYCDSINSSGGVSGYGCDGRRAVVQDDIHSALDVTGSGVRSHVQESKAREGP